MDEVFLEIFNKTTQELNEQGNFSLKKNQKMIKISSQNNILLEYLNEVIRNHDIEWEGTLISRVTFDFLTPLHIKFMQKNNIVNVLLININLFLNRNFSFG